MAQQSGRLRTAGIDLQLDLDGDLPAIWADENQVGRVVAHLIDIAAQAMTDAEPPRRLSIATALDRPSGMARLAIAGSGPWDATTGGSGIGLSLCRAIVIAHGGALATDAGPDGGAHFLLHLPIAAAPPARSP